MDLRAKIHQTLPWLLQKRTLWVILILLVISPPIWLGWTQPWQYQPQVPTGPLPEEIAQRPAYPLPPEIQAAKDEGMRLWGLQTPDSMDASEPLLELAAEYGDGDAMYFLGELQRRSSMGGFSTSAMEWYVQGARAGEVYSMLRLHQAGVCRTGSKILFPQYCAEDQVAWSIKAYEWALPRAEAGDADAMLILHIIVGGGWLRRAAEADNPEAQMEIGMFIGDGVYPGWPYYRYWPKEARLRAALPWYRRAAELGYAPAMDKLARALRWLNEDYEEEWKWRKKAALHGHLDANFAVAACYIGPTFPERCPVSINIAKGYGIFLSLIEQGAEAKVKGTGGWIASFSHVLDDITEEEQEHAEVYAQEWLDQLQAPFSAYPPRWGL